MVVRKPTYKKWWLDFQGIHFSPRSFLLEACSCTDCTFLHLRTGRDASEAGGNVPPPRPTVFSRFFSVASKGGVPQRSPRNHDKHDLWTYDIHPLSMCVLVDFLFPQRIGPNVRLWDNTSVSPWRFLLNCWISGSTLRFFVCYVFV